MNPNRSDCTRLWSFQASAQVDHYPQLSDTPWRKNSGIRGAVVFASAKGDDS